jgi:hypothetical protein
VATGECTSPEAYVVLIDTWNIGVANMISGEYQSFINGVLTYALTTSEPGTYWIAAASAFGDASLYWGGPGMTSLTTPWLPTTVEVGVYNLSVATFEMNVVWP